MTLYQVDAFANSIFQGNPAAVVPLDEWLPDATLQAIAEENNLSETAFYVPSENGFHIRWFTPVAEVDLCGHATLATAHVLWNHLQHPANNLAFESRSGQLNVYNKGNGWYTLDFPTDRLRPIEPPSLLADALNAPILACFMGREDLMAVLEGEDALLNLKPDFSSLRKLEARGVICTARGKDCDFASRCFYPAYGIDEDPVTGSAHTTLTPYWAQQLGRNYLQARQLSKRGGSLICELHGERTFISGQAATYLIGKISI